MADPLYEFRTVSGNPCDLCDGLEGGHDTPPYVPVHPHCACAVHEHEGSVPDMRELEVRNVETQESEYTETITHAEFSGFPAEEPVRVEVHLGLHSVDLDDPLTVDDLDIEIPTGTVAEEDTIPARVRGSIEYDVVFTEYVVRAELWRVGTVATAEGSAVDEEHVGDVGGFVVVRSDMENLTIVESGAELDDGGEDGDDEVPI